MSNINSVTITGNLCADPELTNFANGGSKARLRVAVNGGYKSRETNEWVEKAHFFTVEVFNGQAEAAAQHLSKGRKVGVNGRLDYQEWEAQDGGKRSQVVIRANTLEYLDGPGERTAPDDAPAPSAAQSTTADGGSVQTVPTNAAAADDVDDSDIPF